MNMPAETILHSAYIYLALSGALTVLLWVPYILARVFVWGIPTFLHNYPKGFPATEPEMPLWAQRSKRAHLNMVETLPPLVAVVLAATQLNAGNPEVAASIALWTAVFFYARLAHAIVYTFGTPYLRTPVYLVSWFAILAIAAQALL